MILSATLPPDRLFLLGHVNDAHAPLADLLEQLVMADSHAPIFTGWRGRELIVSHLVVRIGQVVRGGMGIRAWVQWFATH